MDPRIPGRVLRSKAKDASKKPYWQTDLSPVLMKKYRIYNEPEDSFQEEEPDFFDHSFDSLSACMWAVDKENKSKKWIADLALFVVFEYHEHAGDSDYNYWLVCQKFNQIHWMGSVEVHVAASEALGKTYLGTLLGFSFANVYALNDRGYATDAITGLRVDTFLKTTYGMQCISHYCMDDDEWMFYHDPSANGSHKTKDFASNEVIYRYFRELESEYDTKWRFYVPEPITPYEGKEEEGTGFYPPVGFRAVQYEGWFAHIPMLSDVDDTLTVRLWSITVNPMVRNLLVLKVLLSKIVKTPVQGLDTGVRYLTILYPLNNEYGSLTEYKDAEKVPLFMQKGFMDAVIRKYPSTAQNLQYEASRLAQGDTWLLWDEMTQEQKQVIMGLADLPMFTGDNWDENVMGVSEAWDEFIEENPPSDIPADVEVGELDLGAYGEAPVPYVRQPATPAWLEQLFQWFRKGSDIYWAGRGWRNG